MRLQARNKRTVYYALNQGQTAKYDANGLYTGENNPTYAAPVQVKMHVSPAKRKSDLEMFGITSPYDVTLLTDDMSCPITEDSVLWINKSPLTQTEGVYAPHNYVVTQVAVSLNHIAYAARRVETND